MSNQMFLGGHPTLINDGFNQRNVVATMEKCHGDNAGFLLIHPYFHASIFPRVGTKCAEPGGAALVGTQFLPERRPISYVRR
jgi:hypothetical protein